MLLQERVFELEARFKSLLKRNFLINDEQAKSLFLALRDRYAESHRAYHTLKHISHCLSELDQVLDPVESRDEIELAVWYHDAIYEIRSKTNEEDSADLLFQDLGTFQTTLDLKHVRELILASKHLGASVVSHTPSIDLFLDLDLAILGQSSHDYELYRREIREEYKSVGRLLYAYGRKKVLKHFASKPLFRTDRFRTRYEAQAHQNLTQEIRSYWWVP